MLYAYLILLVGSLASYHGAPTWSVVLIAMLLTLPTVGKYRGERALTMGTVASAANALIFALVSFGIGRGVALILGA